LITFGRKQIARPTVLRPSEVVAEMQQVLQVMRGDVRVSLDLSPDAGSVKADRGEFEQIVLNLVLKASDAMPNGGDIKINVGNVDIDEAFSRSHPAVSVGAYVVLSVKDTGVGISDESQTRLFQPFFTTKEKGQGAGLGLYTTYNIVKKSGGAV